MADTLNAMMARANLSTLALLSPVVLELTREGAERVNARGDGLCGG